MNTLKQSRQQLGLTQEKMAQVLGLSLRTYTRHEKAGGSAPVRKLAELLAAAPKAPAQNLQ